VFAKKTHEKTILMFKKDGVFYEVHRKKPFSIPFYEEGDILPKWNDFGLEGDDELIVISHNWDELRRTMWNYVGIVRSDKRLQRARRRVDNLLSEIKEYYWNFKITPDLLELRNITEVASLIIKSADLRKESRGTHYTIDYPQKDDKNFRHPTVI